MKRFFENKQEEEMYVQECNRQFFKNTKIGVILSIILFAYGILLDFVISSEIFWQLFILHFIQTFCLFSIFFLLYKNKIKEKNKAALDSIWIIFGIVPIYIMIYMTGGSTSSYCGGLNIVMVAVTQLLIYSFNKSIKFCVIVIISYIITIFLPQKVPFNWASFYTNMHFLILTAIISCVACYFLTLHRIKRFKANYKIQTLLKEKEETELKLIRSERLNAIGTLAAGIIHEINNPLNNMGPHLDYIEENAKRADILDSVYEIRNFGIAPIEKITGSLRDFCGNIGNAEPVLLSELIASAQHLVGDAIRGLKVNINIVEEDKVMVIKNDIILLFTNLFINSAYALKKAKKNRININIFKSKDSFIISFKDNGIGIEKENLKKIFDPFFTTKPQDIGLGLGLSACHRIVDNHKGNLKVESKKGEFTEFIFDLPRISKEKKNVGK